MEKGFNLQIEEFKENIIREINNSNLPITVVEMIFQKLLSEITVVKQQTLKMEQDKLVESDRNNNTPN